MPYFIRVSSQKGGVGKTTIAVNLAVALQLKGYKTLLCDADTVNPTIAFHLGFEDANIGMKQVMLGKTTLQEARVEHAPTGLHIIPGVLGEREYVVTTQMMNNIANKIKKTDYDFVIVDTSPGYSVEKMENYYNEALLISTPDMSSIANAIRLASWFDKAHLKHNLVINKVMNRRYELHHKEMEQMYENRIISTFQYDEYVMLSTAESIPACLYKKEAKFSRAINDLADMYAAKSGIVRTTDSNHGIFSWFSSKLRRRM